MNVRRLLLGVGFVTMWAVSQTTASIVISPLGYSAPPGTLGSFPLTAFQTDSRPPYSSVSHVALPADLSGSLTFSAMDGNSLQLTHHRNSNGWSGWGHGYFGDVYKSPLRAFRIVLPENTKAFYFYAEPKSSVTLTPITAKAHDGTELVQSASIFTGSVGFGISATGESEYLEWIDVAGLKDFAIGEFGIYEEQPIVGHNPEPGSLLVWGGIGLCSLAYAWRRRSRR